LSVLQIVNAKLEAEVSRRELADKARLVHRQDEQLQAALKEARRYQAEAEELRRQLNDVQEGMRLAERNTARSESENAELREQKRLVEEMLKKAQDWNDQLGDRDASEINRLSKIIKESESEILGLNKLIHELKLQLNKARDDAENCRRETSSLQQMNSNLEQEVNRHLASIETHKQTNAGLEKEITNLNEQLREIKRRWDVERASLLKEAQAEKETALAELRERMQKEFEFEREQLRATKKHASALQSEVSRLSESLVKVEQEWQIKFGEEQRIRSALAVELENTRIALSNLRASHEQELAKLHEELRTKEHHCRDIQSELERFARLLREMEVEAERLRQLCQEKDEQVRPLHAMIEKVTDELTNVRTELAQRHLLESEQLNKAAETKYHLDLLVQELAKTKHSMALKLAATVADLQHELRAELRKNARYESNMRYALEKMRKLHLDGKQVLSDKVEHLSNLAASLTEEVIELRSHDREYETIIQAVRLELTEVRQSTDQSISVLRASNQDLQGALDNATWRVRDLERELQELRDVCAIHKSENEKLHGERSRCEVELQQLRAELADKTRMLEKVTRPLESEILALNKQVHELHVALEKMTNKYQQATETLRKELDKVRKLEIEIEELRNRLGKLPEVELDLQRERARGLELQAEFERERSARMKVERDLQNRDAELLKLRVQITNQSQEIKKQGEQIARLTDELKLRTQECAESKRAFEERERSLSAEKKRMENIITAKDEELERLRRQLLESRNQINELNSEIIILRQNQGDKDLLAQYRNELKEAWAAVRALELQINHLQQEASERKSWTLSKSQRVIQRVEEAWRNRVRAEIQQKNEALRECDQLRTLLVDKETTIRRLNEKDATIRQLQADIEHGKAQINAYKVELESLRAHLDKAKAALVDSELECDRLRDELAKQAKTLKAEVRALRSAPPPPPPPPPLRDTSHLIRCRDLIRLLYGKVKALSLAQVHNVSDRVGDTCTLGFSYFEQPGKEAVITHVLTGGPAFKSKRMHKGDFILLVDGAQVAGEKMTDALKGNNTPGSKVKLTIRKGTTGKIESVELIRVLTATIADKRRLFDLFCKISLPH